MLSEREQIEQYRNARERMEAAGKAFAAEEARKREWAEVPKIVVRPDPERIVQRLSDEFEVVRTRPEQIIKEVCTKYGVTYQELISDRRTKVFIYPRHEACWRLSKETIFSLPKIGAVMGNRDHTTVLNAVERHQERLTMGLRDVIVTYDELERSLRRACEYHDVSVPKIKGIKQPWPADNIRHAVYYYVANDTGVGTHRIAHMIGLAHNTITVGITKHKANMAGNR